MARIELVVTDLDGTLWGADQRIHQRTRRALDALGQRGVPVVAATGRRLRSAAGALARAGTRMPALVVLDGALGHEVAARRTFHQVAFTREQAIAVLETFHDADLSPCVYVDRDDADIVVGPATSTSARHVATVGPWLCEEPDLRPVVEREPVLMFSIVGADPSGLAPITARLGPDLAATTLTRDIVLGGTTLTVRPPGISKWQGVLAWCDDQGLDPDRVLAVGDGQNDLELLTGAHVACVVADGCDEALAVADHVLAPPDEGGWSAVARLV